MGGREGMGNGEDSALGVSCVRAGLMMYYLGYLTRYLPKMEKREEGRAIDTKKTPAPLSRTLFSLSLSFTGYPDPGR